VSCRASTTGPTRSSRITCRGWPGTAWSTGTPPSSHEHGSLAENRLGILGTVAHEFFHAWSIERIRPATLEPFDFEEANMSRELWFGEGFTSYYDDLILWRAGLIDDGEFAARMGSIAEAVTSAPGRRFFSPVEMSMQAPFVDAAVAIDPQNRSNVFLSYYTWGSGDRARSRLDAPDGLRGPHARSPDERDVACPRLPGDPV
jgi:hypothetical protein